MPKKLEVNGNVTGNLLIKVENFEICSLSHQQTRSDYLLPTARRVPRFIFVFFLSWLRWVGDGRTWTWFTFKAPLTRRSSSSLRSHWTSKALQSPSTMFWPYFTAESPRQRVLFTLNLWPFWLFLWRLFLHGSFLNLQKLLLLGHGCEQGGPIHWWFCSRHWIFSSSLKRSE